MNCSIHYLHLSVTPVHCCISDCILLLPWWWQGQYDQISLHGFAELLKMRSSCASLSHPWLTLSSLSSLTPAAPPFSPECSRCWEEIIYQQWETAFFSLPFVFVLNLKLLYKTMALLRSRCLSLWYIGAFCPVKKICCWIQANAKLLGYRKNIAEFHCIRSVHSVV